MSDERASDWIGSFVAAADATVSPAAEADAE